ncbi:MAG: transposase [Candidatus Zixiibacteriota bacterium]
MDTQPAHRKTIRHYNVPGHAHFLTFSCYQRRPLLVDDVIRLLFVRQLATTRDTLEYDLWAYVIMPDHVHLLVRPRKDDHSISEFLRALKRNVGFHALNRLQETGYSALSFWQAGPGFDQNVSDPGRATELAAYIHNNPVRRGLVAEATEWRWSSAHFWAGWPDYDLAMDEIS